MPAVVLKVSISDAANDGIGASVVSRAAFSSNTSAAAGTESHCAAVSASLRESGSSTTDPSRSRMKRSSTRPSPAVKRSRPPTTMTRTRSSEMDCSGCAPPAVTCTPRDG
jgi:hypothetical protein